MTWMTRFTGVTEITRMTRMTITRMTGIFRMSRMTRLQGGGGVVPLFEKKLHRYFFKDTFSIFEGFQSET